MLSDRTEKRRGNRLHKIKPCKQQENPEIVYTEIKIFFASAAKQTEDLSRKNLKQQEGYNGYNGTDRNRQTIRFLTRLYCLHRS